MPATVEILVDGRPIRAAEGTTLAAALLDAGVWGFRTSVRGEPRAPICGMGICFECRVTVNGEPLQRACLIACEGGMVVATGGAEPRAP